jgi:hypothetical protein
MIAHPFIQAIPHQDGEQVCQGPLRDVEVAVHVRFGEPEIAESEGALEHPLVPDSHRDRWRTRTATRDARGDRRVERDARVDDTPVEKLEKQVRDSGAHD